MQYKVPQNVQREDQILWFITLRQLVMLMIGFGISYWLYTSINKDHVTNLLENILIWTPAGLSVLFAFVRVKHVSLMQFILLTLEQFVFRGKKRYWVQHGGEPFVSMTTGFILKGKKEAANQDPKNVSAEKIKKLAQILDGEKSEVQKKKNL